MDDACLALDTVPPKWYSQINELSHFTPVKASHFYNTASQENG